MAFPFLRIPSLFCPFLALLHELWPHAAPNTLVTHHRVLTLAVPSAWGPHHPGTSLASSPKLLPNLNKKSQISISLLPFKILQSVSSPPSSPLSLLYFFYSVFSNSKFHDTCCHLLSSCQGPCRFLSLSQRMIMDFDFLQREYPQDNKLFSC